HDRGAVARYRLQRERQQRIERGGDTRQGWKARILRPGIAGQDPHVRPVFLDKRRNRGAVCPISRERIVARDVDESGASRQEWHDEGIRLHSVAQIEHRCPRQICRQSYVEPTATIIPRYVVTIHRAHCELQELRPQEEGEQVHAHPDCSEEAADQRDRQNPCDTSHGNEIAAIPRGGEPQDPISCKSSSEGRERPHSRATAKVWLWSASGTTALM